MRRLALLLCVLRGPPPSAADPAPVTAIRAGRLLDVAAERVRENVVIVVEGDQYARSARRSRRAPPLIDLSAAHGDAGDDRRAHPRPAAGRRDRRPTTTSRSSASRSPIGRCGRPVPCESLSSTASRPFATWATRAAGFADADLKRAVEAGVVAGPRLFVATKALGPTGAYPLQAGAWELEMPKGVEMCDGPDECRRAVRDQIAHGADWIKVYADRSYYQHEDGSFRSLPNFTAEELGAIVDQAHRTRRKVAAHSVTPTGHALALAAGVDSIEHGDVLDDETIAAMAERRVYWCPTLTVTDYVAGPRSVTNPVWGELREAAHASFRRALAAGVPIVVGTDAGRLPLGRDPPGGGAAALRRAGDDAVAGALRSATVVAAAMLGQEGVLGTIAPGAKADIVAMPERPPPRHHGHRARELRDEGRGGLPAVVPDTAPSWNSAGKPARVPRKRASCSPDRIGGRHRPGDAAQPPSAGQRPAHDERSQR